MLHPAARRQFFLRDGELVGLAGLDDEFAPVSLTDGARNCATKMTMTQRRGRSVRGAQTPHGIAVRRSARRLSGSVRYALWSSAFMSLIAVANASGRTLPVSP